MLGHFFLWREIANSAEPEGWRFVSEDDTDWPETLDGLADFPKGTQLVDFMVGGKEWERWAYRPPELAAAGKGGQVGRGDCEDRFFEIVPAF